MINGNGSSFFSYIGLGNLDIGYLFLGIIVVILILVVLLIRQTIKINQLKERIEKFMKGKEGMSLEQDIVALFEDNKFLKISSEKNRKDIQELYQKAEKAYQRKGLVKYDAFNQMGGQLSFSLCLLDEKNNGFIINSVHSTDGCYSYTKEIKNGISNIPLGKEEEEALSIAISE